MCVHVCVGEGFFVFVMRRKIMRTVMQVSHSLDGCSPAASLHHLPTVATLPSQQVYVRVCVCVCAHVYEGWKRLCVDLSYIYDCFVLHLCCCVCVCVCV